MPVLPRVILRVAVGCAIAVFAVRTVSSGAVTNGWDVVGLVVAVFTLAYASLACGQLLPGRRVVPEPVVERVSAASPVATGSGAAQRRRLVRS